MHVFADVCWLNCKSVYFVDMTYSDKERNLIVYKKGIDTIVALRKMSNGPQILK